MRTTHYPDTVVPAPTLMLSAWEARPPRNSAFPNPMDKPLRSRPKRRNLLVLSACVSGVLLAWWAPQGFRSGSSRATTSLPEASAPGFRAERPAPAVSSSSDTKAEQVVQVQAVAQAQTEMHDAALREPGSPVNTLDPDKNREWARAFPAAAVAWLGTAPAGGQGVAVAEILCPELMAVSPMAAVTLAESRLGDGTDDAAKNLLDNMAHQWAEKDMQAASDWALGKPEGAQRDRLLQRVAFVKARTDPQEAARLVFEKMSPGPDQNEAAVSVLCQWARRDAGAALAWAESFPPGELRERALEEVVAVASVASARQFSGANPGQ